MFRLKHTYTTGDCRDRQGAPSGISQGSAETEFWTGVAKAADATTLAAAAEISQRVFEETGGLQPTSKTWANAQAFASMNNSYLNQYGVSAVVTGISVDAGEDTVLVQVSANLDRLFPSVVPDLMVTENGYAEIRAFTR